MRNRLIVLAWLVLASSSWAAPYEWTGPVAPAFVAPTDVKSDDTVTGACLQGALVDIRYGQVCIDVSGVGEVLDTGKQSVLTLDGQPTSEAALQKLLKKSTLSVAVRYDPQTGQIGWLDTYTNESPAPRRLRASLEPWKGPAYDHGERVRILVDGGVAGSLTIPGLCHELPLTVPLNGRRSASLLVRPGLDLRSVPIYLHQLGKVQRIGQLSAAPSPPEVRDYGPQRASRHLGGIPAWIDFHSASGLLDPTSIRVRASNGAEVVDLQRRVDRTDFKLEVPGGGSYLVTVEASDQLGRSVQQEWSVTVR